MRFSIVDDVRTPPSQGLTGTCPVCGSPTIAKCGPVRVHHWAHRGERHCDPWWEPETEWHRTWKKRFPAHCQEYIQHASSGEKHIADVRTEHGLVIEFQHSHLRPDERGARETFYKNMVWIVDGRRLVRDLPRFLKGLHEFRKTVLNGVYLCHFPEEIFPANWRDCPVPVFFDFGEENLPAEAEPHIKNLLWCLLPERVDRQAVVLALRKEQFVALALSKAEPIPVKTIIAQIVYPLLLARQEQARHLATLQAMARFYRGSPRTRRRSRRF